MWRGLASRSLVMPGPRIGSGTGMTHWFVAPRCVAYDVVSESRAWRAARRSWRTRGVVRAGIRTGAFFRRGCRHATALCSDPRPVCTCGFPPPSQLGMRAPVRARYSRAGEPLPRPTWQAGPDTPPRMERGWTHSTAVRAWGDKFAKPLLRRPFFLPHWRSDGVAVRARVLQLLANRSPAHRARYEAACAALKAPIEMAQS